MPHGALILTPTIFRVNMSTDLRKGSIGYFGNVYVIKILKTS